QGGGLGWGSSLIKNSICTDRPPPPARRRERATAGDLPLSGGGKKRSIHVGGQKHMLEQLSCENAVFHRRRSGWTSERPPANIAAMTYTNPSAGEGRADLRADIRPVGAAPTRTAVGAAELHRLSVGNDGRLFWDDKPVLVRRRLVLTFWQKIGAIFI